MFYEKDIVVPAGTTQAAPAQESLFVVPGVIHYVGIQFPNGCAGLVHCVIENQEVQTWPRNPAGTFKSDGFIVEFNEAFEITQGNTHFKIKAWAPNTDNQHTITIRLGLLRREDMFPLWTVFKAIQLFFKLFKPRATEETEGT